MTFVTSNLVDNQVTDQLTASRGRRVDSWLSVVCPHTGGTVSVTISGEVWGISKFRPRILEHSYLGWKVQAQGTTPDHIWPSVWLWVTMTENGRSIQQRHSFLPACVFGCCTLQHAILTMSMMDYSVIFVQLKIMVRKNIHHSTGFVVIQIYPWLLIPLWPLANMNLLSLCCPILLALHEI